MTTTEIVEAIYELPAGEWETIKEAIDNGSRSSVPKPKPNYEPKTQMSEDEVNKILFAEGIIGNIPDLSQWTEEDEDWEPFEITGKPTSEIIIEDRG